VKSGKILIPRSRKRLRISARLRGSPRIVGHAVNNELDFVWEIGRGLMWGLVPGKLRQEERLVVPIYELGSLRICSGPLGHRQEHRRLVFLCCG
jgi:hypothetical protein